MKDSRILKVLGIVRRFLQTDLGIALAITLLWKIVMTTIGYAVDSHSGGATSLWDHTIRWDANWYLSIIDGHYSNITASAAFYPLFPLLVYIVHVISFGSIDYPLAAQLINTTAVWLAVTAAIKLTRIFIGPQKRFLIVALLLSAPAAFFMHVFYSEAIFVALSFWAYYFALTKRWLFVGIVLGVLTAARLPSVLIVALCGLEYLRAYNWNIKKALNLNILYFLIAPIGFIVFGFYLMYIQHDFLGMFHAYAQTKDWSYQVFNPNILKTITAAGYELARGAKGVRPINAEFITNAFLPFFSLFVLGLSSLYLIIKHTKKLLPLGIVGLLSIVMFTINSNIVSVHRYVLPSLTIYIAIILFFKNKRSVYIYIICLFGILAQALLYKDFILGIFAG